MKVLQELFISACAVQVQARILICSGLCLLNEQTERITVTNAVDFATSCFQNATALDTQSAISDHLYLDSTNGSCTDDIYDLLNDFIASLGGVDIAIPCQSKCSALDYNTEATIQAAGECFSYFSPPIVPVTPEESYEFYASNYALEGQCTYRQYNERQQAIRKYIIDPSLLDSINGPIN